MEKAVEPSVSECLQIFVPAFIVGARILQFDADGSGRASEIEPVVVVGYCRHGCCRLLLLLFVARGKKTLEVRRKLLGQRHIRCHLRNLQSSCCLLKELLTIPVRV